MLILLLPRSWRMREVLPHIGATNVWGRLSRTYTRVLRTTHAYSLYNSNYDTIDLARLNNHSYGRDVTYQGRCQSDPT